MRKQTLTFILAAAFIAALGACKKTENNSGQSATLGKATISGTVAALLVDTVGASNSQVAPANTVIHAWIDTKDFVVNPANSITYAQKYYTTKVDANGKYTLTVDVSQYQEATVHIVPQSFIYDQVRNTRGVIVRDSIYTVSKTYNAPSSTVTVFNDLSTTQGINYN